MEKYENDIHNCTSERLAEMLENTANYLLEYEKNIRLTQEERKAAEFEYKLLTEAASRLRERMRPTFNNEAFE